MKLRVYALTLTICLILAVASSACTSLPTVTNPATSSEVTTNEGGTLPAAEAAAPMASGAMATVATRSLRVRQEPSETSEVVAGIAEGESYRVIGLSEDGLWVQLAIENTPDNQGWVSANFVTVEGDITDLNTVPVSDTTPVESTAVESTTVVTQTAPATGFAVVSTEGSRLRIRSGPSTDSPIVGYAYDGESYAVLETSEDGVWVKIPAAAGENSNNTDNTEGGWVAAEFLIIGQ
ncbi:MAG: SH3 domain-containing protein [Caldilineaceae bacterium]